ncbi:MAG: SDR family NAD(P)-dependent oxidoreductase [Burkholderiales bacterium]
MNEWSGRTAIITGAGSGIGRAIALACAARGMRLVLADLHAESIEETKALAGQDNALMCITDVSDPMAVEELAQRTYSETGDAGLLFNNAGVASAGLIWETSPQDWAWVIGVNLMGVVHGIRAFVPRMLKQGKKAHVVNTASAAGLMSIMGVSAYCASKHAVVSVSECLYQELMAKKTMIGVSVLCPGYVLTGIAESEKHRPAKFGVKTSGRPPSESQIEQTLRRAKLTPDDIAAITLRAVDENVFYVLPHPKILEGVQARFTQIQSNGSPYCGALPTGD